MVVLAVTWMAKPGHQDEVAGIFGKLQTASRQEPGCLMYIVHRHRTDSTRFFIYEQYRDEAALEEPVDLDHLGFREPLLRDRAVQVEELGHGVEFNLASGERHAGIQIGRASCRER